MKLITEKNVITQFHAYIIEDNWLECTSPLLASSSNDYNWVSVNRTCMQIKLRSRDAVRTVRKIALKHQLGPQMSLAYRFTGINAHHAHI